MVFRPAVRKGLAGAVNFSPLLKRGPNTEAFLMTLLGYKTVVPCICCAKLGGPWQDCRVKEGVSSGSCNNCHYNGRSTRCSFRSQPSEVEGPSAVPQKFIKTEPNSHSQALPTSTSGGSSSNQDARLLREKLLTLRDIQDDAISQLEGILVKDAIPKGFYTELGKLNRMIRKL